MESTRRYVIGIDYGTDSCRALVVDTQSGEELSSGVAYYSRWKAGLYCDAASNRYRQHPSDYTDALVDAVRSALSPLDQEAVSAIVGLCFDTTGSTPALCDAEGRPLALRPEFADEPDAMFILWKDHTAVRKAERITRLVEEEHLDYLKYEGGTYSAEWVWAKVLHVIETNPSVAAAAYSWVEHCDWMTALLTGTTKPEAMLRSRCAAGHKAMWHASWGLPSAAFLSRLHPRLAELRPHLFRTTAVAGTPAGRLTDEWASRLGLPSGIAVSVGLIDAHAGAVGASIAPGVLVRIMGTSTCDIMVTDEQEVGSRCIPGICGQVDGSVLPGYVGFEAGQSAFGDIYAWFARLLSWGLDRLPTDEKVEEVKKFLLSELSREAALLTPSLDGLVALDWLNGRRTPYADQHVKGVLSGLTLGSTAPEIYRALVEATAFGSRRIVEHMKSEGLPVDAVHAIGGISKKAPFVMQVLADVLDMPIRVVRSEQACALGAAMFAAVAAGVYGRVEEAVKRMGSGIECEYIPNPAMRSIYDNLYDKYRQLAKLFAHL